MNTRFYDEQQVERIPLRPVGALLTGVMLRYEKLRQLLGGMGACSSRGRCSYRWEKSEYRRRTHQLSPLLLPRGSRVT